MRRIFGWILCILHHAYGNYILNGDFESPAISSTSFLTTTQIPYWTGSFDLMGPKYGGAGLFKTQYLDLATTVNGFLSQTVILPSAGIYLLQFVVLKKLAGTYPAEISWNGVVIQSYEPAVRYVLTNFSIEVTGKKGSNMLLFVQRGKAISSGINIDDVTLVLKSTTTPTPTPTPTPTTPTHIEKMQSEILTNLILILSYIVSLPLSQMKLYNLCMVLQDLWMYIFTNRHYSQSIQQIFKTVSQVQNIKWSLFQWIYHTNLNKISIPISNYTAYSNPISLRVNEKDSSIISNLNNYFLVTIPQTIIIFFILRSVFYKIQNNSISVYLRRFCFLPCSIFQSLLEGNLSYFSYLFFNQFQIIFSFSFNDKCFLILAVSLFWACLIYGLCFYYLIAQFYGSKSGYFLHECYRFMPGVTFNMIINGILRMIWGILFSLLWNRYEIQAYILIFFQFFRIAFHLTIQTSFHVFTLKSSFSFRLVYHSLLFLCNIALLVEYSIVEESAIKNLVVKIQTIVIYIMIAVIIMETICEFLFERKRPISKNKKIKIVQIKHDIIKIKNEFTF